jgi:hypothetical protein
MAMTPEEEKRLMAAIMREMGQGEEQPMNLGGHAMPTMPAQSMEYSGVQSQAPASSGGMPPGGMGVASQFMGGGGGAGGGGGGSMMASAGPWAALAAAIAVNETEQRKDGNRPDSVGNQWEQAFTGEALERDAERYGDKIGGPLGKVTSKMGELGNPKGLGKNLEKLSKPWEIFEDWF